MTLRDVILVHGLWVPGAVMRPLAWRLAQAGFRCRMFSYQGAARPLEAHAERLAHLARETGPAHFVGHSLGGLVVLEALLRHAQIAAGRVVLLGAPVRGCAAGRRLARLPAGRWFLGRSEELWREGREARWTRPEALGVIAGSLPIGLGRLLGRLHNVNDGVVGLDETGVEGMAERVVLPVGHGAMLVSARVAAQVAAFLTDAGFAPHRA
jgi:pimeloyl-ACP methyl ester carboxylesterase